MHKILTKIIYIFIANLVIFNPNNAHAQICSVVDEFIVADTASSIFSIEVGLVAGQGPVSSNQNIPEVMGGWRHMSISEYIGGTGTTLTVVDNIPAYPSGIVAMSQGAGTSSSEQFRYNANGAGLNQDFSSIDAFKIQFIADDAGGNLAGHDVTVTLIDGNTNSASLTLTLFKNNSPHTVDFEVASFNNIGILDLTDIDDIIIDILDASQVDIAIDRFEFCSSALAVAIPVGRWNLLILALMMLLTVVVSLSRSKIKMN